MNINTNSWHYKLVKNTFRSGLSPMPRSLCPYMRAVLYRVSFFGSVLAFFGFLFSNMLADSFISIGITGIWAYIASFFGAVIGFGLLFALAAGIVFGGVWTFIKVQAWWENRKAEKQMAARLKAIEDIANGIEPKKPNVLVEYAKASHDKICPTIEYKAE